MSRLPASSDNLRRNKLMYSETGTRLFRTSWATWDAICPRSARRFLRASSRFFSSSSLFSRATSAQSVSCVRSSRSVAVCQAASTVSEVGVLSGSASDSSSRDVDVAVVVGGHQG